MVRASQSESLVALAGELRGVLGKLIRRLREQSNHEDSTSSQKSVLLRLEREGSATVSELARAESVRPQSMRITVAGLAALGAVKGRPDPADARKTIFSLTAGFLKVLHSNRAAKEDWLYRAMEAQLLPQEQQVLADAAKLLQRVAEF